MIIAAAYSEHAWIDTGRTWSPVNLVVWIRLYGSNLTNSMLSSAEPMKEKVAAYGTRFLLPYLTQGRPGLVTVMLSSVLKY